MSAPLLGRDHLPDRISPQTSIERTAAHAQAQAQAGRRRSTPTALSPLPPSPSPREIETDRPPRVLIIYTGGTIGMKSGPNGYEPAPNYLANMLRAQPAFHNPAMQKEVPPDFLITPHSIYGRNIAYRILEFNPLLDSSCMSMAEWVKVAETIAEHYHVYDAFVVLHGTDTLAYTASALSFMLEDLGKTVIVTGAQIPITEHLNDAASNLLGTLTIAGHFVIPEVCVFFAGRLYRGNRVIKIDSSHVDAFASPNKNPLAEIGTGISIDWGAIFVPPDAVHAFQVRCHLDPHVAVLHFFPGITAAAVAAFLQPPIKGVVLQTFGAGNVFDERCDILALIRAAVSQQIIVVNCTQCVAGSVNTVDATGHALLAAGAVPGYDMTTEAALTKLCYVLGLPDLSFEARCQMMSSSLRGELTIPDVSGDFAPRAPSLVERVASTLMASSKREMEMVTNALIPVLLSSAVSDPTVPLPLERLHELEVEAIRTSNFPAGDVEVSEFRSLRHTQLAYDDSGRTPLHVAARAGHEAAVRVRRVVLMFVSTLPAILTLDVRRFSRLARVCTAQIAAGTQLCTRQFLQSRLRPSHTCGRPGHGWTCRLTRSQLLCVLRPRRMT
eukprot:m.83408 g.83408  ORF g.83408 m.83408 type:complete len:611 (+) comp13445_c0_seq1:24-1856(+)